VAVTVEKANWESGFFADRASFLKQEVFLEIESVYRLFISSFKVIFFRLPA